ncbi:MAG TPA: hypothetical protein VME40_13870 [Caulobacteraceae bacterium]|nr:hypothetical protein [Caulobacteraceae bacterium]
MSCDVVWPDDPAGFVLARGRAGFSRVEIASAMGVTVAALERRANDDAGLAAALALAEEAAKAWWLALPREAIATGKSLNQGLWREAMASRFGRAALNAPPRPTVRFEIPDNGRPLRKVPARGW